MNNVPLFKDSNFLKLKAFQKNEIIKLDQGKKKEILDILKKDC